MENHDHGNAAMQEFGFAALPLNQAGAPNPGRVAGCLVDITTALHQAVATGDLGAITIGVAALDRLRLGLDAWNTVMAENQAIERVAVGGSLAELRAICMRPTEPNDGEKGENRIKEMMGQYLQEREEQAKQAKSALFGYLAERHSQIAHIEVRYDGYGDEGNVNEVHCYDTLDRCAKAAELKDDKLQELIENVFDCVTPDGFEINEGGDGEIHIYPASQRIIVRHNYNIVHRNIKATRHNVAHPYHHALSSVRKWGGQVDDYLPIHNWFDESKAMLADFRHRALRHHAEGIFLCERIFGITITVGNGRKIPVRWIGEQHVKEDLGRIPTVADWLMCIKPEKWMNNATRLSKEMGDVEPAIPTRLAIATHQPLPPTVTEALAARQ